jgi:hypothetical protein
VSSIRGDVVAHYYKQLAATREILESPTDRRSASLGAQVGDQIADVLPAVFARLEPGERTAALLRALEAFRAGHDPGGGGLALARRQVRDLLLLPFLLLRRRQARR